MFDMMALENVYKIGGGTISTNRNVRLVDIASELGLTVNTVSRALRDKPDIGEETKRKVKQTASEMGYIPNSIASSLRQGSSKTIAIVFDNLMNPYFMIMADKIHRKLNILGFASMIFAGHQGKLDKHTVETIVSRKVDGIITFLEPHTEVVDQLKLNRIPTILVGRKNSKLMIDSVATDDFDGAYKVGQLFIETKANRIAYIGAPKEIECSRRRLKGLKQALIDQNKTIDETLYIYQDHDTLEKTLDALLCSNVDAIFCFNDMIALEVCTLLSKKSIPVPASIRVAGFDDIQSELFIPIRLTTVSTNKEQIIDKTVELLLEQLQDKDQNHHHVQHVDYPVELKRGETA